MIKTIINKLEKLNNLFHAYIDYYVERFDDNARKKMLYTCECGRPTSFDEAIASGKRYAPVCRVCMLKASFENHPLRRICEWS